MDSGFHIKRIHLYPIHLLIHFIYLILIFIRDTVHSRIKDYLQIFTEVFDQNITIYYVTFLSNCSILQSPRYHATLAATSEKLSSITYNINVRSWIKFYSFNTSNINGTLKIHNVMKTECTQYPECAPLGDSIRRNYTVWHR